MTGKQEISTADAPEPGGTYSQGVAIGGVVYTAGMGPIDPKTGELAGGDVTTQTHQVMRNLAAVLAAHGLGLADVVKTTVHLQDLHRDFAAFNAAYGSYFTAPYPVRTTVGSDLRNMLVEIDIVAHAA